MTNPIIYPREPDRADHVTMSERFQSPFSRRSLFKAGIAAGAVGALARISLGAPWETASRDSSKLTGTLSFSTWQWGEAGFSTYYADAFKAFHKANPSVTLQKISIPFINYFDEILVQMKAGNTPDIYMAGFEDMGQYVAMGALEPLDTLLAGVDFSRFYPTQHEYGRIDGHTYGVVLLNTGFNLWYNKQLFREAGLTPPTGIDQVIPTAKKLAKPPAQYGIAVMNTDTDELVPDVENWLYGWGPGTNWVNAQGKPALHAPAVTECLEWYKSVLNSGACVRGTPKTAYRNMVAEGKVAMMVDGPWYYAMALADNAKSNTFLDVAPTPNRTKYTPLADNILMIPKAAKNKALAAAYIRSLYTEHWQEEYVTLTASPPGWQNAIPPGYLKSNPWFKTYADYATKVVISTPSTYASNSAEYNHILTVMCSSYFFGNTPLERAINQAQAALEKLL